MSIEEKFKSEEIIPDVINVAPKTLLNVKFANKEVNLGNELTPTDVKSAPTVSWTADGNSYYTLSFSDPDAPSRANPIRREFLHWLIGNIPGGDITKGHLLADFVPSGPPQDSGLHRYTFLVYKQKGKVNFEERRIPDTQKEARRHFSIRNFAAKYGFGEPQLGNYYLAQWDKSVG